MINISHVYLCGQYSLHFIENQIIIKNNDDLVRELPIELVESIVIKGSSQISSRTIMELLKRNLPIIFLDSHGKYIGRYSDEKVNIIYQRKQFEYSNNLSYCLDFSKKVIIAKIINQNVVLKRYSKDSTNEKTSISITRNIKKIKAATKISEIRGYEGNAAKLYFEGIANIINEKFKFNGRNRNPSRDPFNSLLNLGYTLLYNELIVAINIKGLNPYAGFMHEDKVGHAALASDLMEEWRAAIIDSLVLNLIQNNIIKIEHFDISNNGVFLNKEGYKIFVDNYEKKINMKTKYLSNIDYKLTFREAIIYKIQSLISTFADGDIDLLEQFIMR